MPLRGQRIRGCHVAGRPEAPGLAHDDRRQDRRDGPAPRVRPSSTADSKIAASLRASAYSPAGKYFCLAWKDHGGSPTAYVSVLQRREGNDGNANHSNHGLSRSRQRGIQTSKGLPFKKYSSNDLDLVETKIVSVNGSMLRRAWFYGRY